MSLFRTFLSFMHTIVHLSNLFFYNAKKYSVYKSHFLMHSPVDDGHLFPVWAYYKKCCYKILIPKLSGNIKFYFSCELLGHIGNVC